MCRRFRHQEESKDLAVYLRDLHSPLLTHLGFWSIAIAKLGHDNIAKISQMTNLRSLELQDWDKWESLKPLRSLSMLEVLSCHGSHMLLDILLCASWSNLKAIILAEHRGSLAISTTYESWLHSMEIDVDTVLKMVAIKLLDLPQLASIQTGPGQDTSYTIMCFASLHADQWLQGQSDLLLYKRIRG